MKENGSKVKVRLLLFLAGLIVMFADRCPSHSLAGGPVIFS